MDNNVIVSPVADQESVVSAYESTEISNISEGIPIPKYLEEVYSWAYLHPNAVRFFERQWIVNLILWGNFISLRNTALDEIGTYVRGRNLQVACVYGDFSQQVAKRLAPDGHLDIVDVAPVQLENARIKVKDYPNVSLHHQDSTNLGFKDASYDKVVVFFLLHEQPLEARICTIREALRVAKPGGKVIFVDYHRPHWSNPFKYIMIPVLTMLEPFALDLWKNEIMDWAPEGLRPAALRKETFFSGLYQKVVVTL
uniref:Methyltransferase domain-containing protein n=1 Tax=Candidatus Kentrum sp. LFY TaxID=2126342 RepID=A0A450WSY6_9GAMM|nr:MAG: Methyltransferase domain-containing protein [Candidatus Kentron sp. LFY]VFJ98954.1 MAG: Methyltransferase domain-containing protein [Candidatus Kentron sp. LFY]VFK20120.1 MAG: Methyltransferase domain-containing protein [Candidatus Kentron sp. LFY]